LGGVSLDDSSLLHRSTKLPGTGSEMVGRPVPLLGISCGRGGRGLLIVSLAGRRLSVCRDDLTLILLIRCASMLRELCILIAVFSVMMFVSFSPRNHLFESNGTLL
jgi:hypothetical protein